VLFLIMLGNFLTLRSYILLKMYGVRVIPCLNFRRLWNQENRVNSNVHGYNNIHGLLTQSTWTVPSVYRVFLFGRGATVAKLMKSPITCWTSATSRFKKHSNGKCETHNTAVLDNFVRVMKRQIVPINEQLDTLLQQQIDTNRKILSSLLKTVFFMWLQQHCS
jgi:hypothetical protein